MEPLDGLRTACPDLVIETGERERNAAAADALRPSRGRPDDAARPLAVIAPATADEVAAVVRWATHAGVAVVVRGGGSGLMGGAAVFGRGVVIDTRRMDRVVVEPDACQVRCGAGAVLAHVDAALVEHGLMLGHDPWTVGVATVGGALSTNGLGYLGGHAGSMGAQVRAVEVVLADGRVLRTRAAPARSVGLDLTRLFVGTDGTLGIVTEATLAVLPRPEERLVHAYRLPSFAAGVAVAVALRRSGVRHACLELSADDLPPAPAALLLVFDGLAGEAALHAARAATVVGREGGEPLLAAFAERWWEGRHDIAERWAANRRAARGDAMPDAARPFDYAHVSVPVAALGEVRARVHGLVRTHGVALVEEGLWHWPELYSVVVAGDPDASDRVRATIEGVCRAAQAVGGSMEYCHGVGVKLRSLLAGEHGPTGAELLLRVKETLDPANVLNPGKG